MDIFSFTSQYASCQVICVPNNEFSEILNGEYKRNCFLDQFFIYLWFIIIHKSNEFSFVKILFYFFPHVVIGGKFS